MSEQRGPGRRPDVKITIKPKQGGQRVAIAAGWREDGKLRLKFDRDVVAVVLKSGEVMAGDVWLDLYENDGDGPPRSARPSVGQSSARAVATAPHPEEGSDFGDDDIPF